jgi:hypothetical protein
MDFYSTTFELHRRNCSRNKTLITNKWEFERNSATKEMGRTKYNVRVAPSMGSFIPSKRDQRMPVGEKMHFCGFERSAIPSLEAMDTVTDEYVGGRNDLLEALCVPILEQRKSDCEFSEHSELSADMRYAINCLQTILPAYMLPTLMRLFPTNDGSKTTKLERTFEELKMEKYKSGIE